MWKPYNHLLTRPFPIRTKLTPLVSLCVWERNLQYESRSYRDGRIMSENQNKMASLLCKIRKLPFDCAQLAYSLLLIFCSYRQQKSRISINLGPRPLFPFFSTTNKNGDYVSMAHSNIMTLLSVISFASAWYPFQPLLSVFYMCIINFNRSCYKSHQILYVMWHIIAIQLISKVDSLVLDRR